MYDNVKFKNKSSLLVILNVFSPKRELINFIEILRTKKIENIKIKNIIFS